MSSYVDTVRWKTPSKSSSSSSSSFSPTRNSKAYAPNTTGKINHNHNNRRSSSVGFRDRSRDRGDDYGDDDDDVSDKGNFDLKMKIFYLEEQLAKVDGSHSSTVNTITNSSNDEVNDLTNKLAVATNKFNTKQNELTTLQTTITSLTTKNTELSKNEQTLVHTLTKKLKENEELKNTCGEYDVIFKEYENTLDLKFSEVDGLTAVKDNLQSDIVNINLANESAALATQELHNKEVNDVNSKLNLYIQKSNKNDMEIKDMISTLQNQVEVIKGLEDSTSKLRGIIDSYDSVIDRNGGYGYGYGRMSSNKNDDSDTSIKKIITNQGTLAHTLAQQTVQLTSLQKANATLQTSYKMKEQECSDVKRSLEEVESNYRFVDEINEEEILRLQNELNTSNSSLLEVNSKLTTLSTSSVKEIEGCKNEVINVTRELNYMKRINGELLESLKANNFISGLSNSDGSKFINSMSVAMVNGSNFDNFGRYNYNYDGDRDRTMNVNDLNDDGSGREVNMKETLFNYPPQTASKSMGTGTSGTSARQTNTETKPTTIKSKPKSLSPTQKSKLNTTTSSTNVKTKKPWNAHQPLPTSSVGLTNLNKVRIRRNPKQAEVGDGNGDGDIVREENSDVRVQAQDVDGVDGVNVDDVINLQAQRLDLSRNSNVNTRPSASNSNNNEEVYRRTNSNYNGYNNGGNRNLSPNPFDDPPNNSSSSSRLFDGFGDHDRDRDERRGEREGEGQNQSRGRRREERTPVSFRNHHSHSQRHTTPHNNNNNDDDDDSASDGNSDNDREEEEGFNYKSPYVKANNNVIVAKTPLEKLKERLTK